MAVSDYSTTAGSNTAISGIALGENVMLPSGVNNAIRQLMADIKAGVPYLSGTTIVIPAAATDGLLLDLSSDTATSGPILDLYRISTTPADNDELGQIRFNGRDDAGNKQRYASIEAVALDVTNGTEDGELGLYVTVANTSTKMLSLSSTGMTLGGGSAVSTIASGSYAPTLTNSANISSSTGATGQYLRVGNIVFASGTVRVTPTAAAGTETILLMSLPVASALSGSQQLAGTAAPNSVTGSIFNEAWAIYAASATDEAALICAAQTTTDHSISFNFMYQVL